MDIFKDYCNSSKINMQNMEILVRFIINDFNDVKKHLQMLPQTDEQSVQRFCRIENYIIQHLSDKITLSDLSELEHLSPQYLSAEFRKKYDRTFGDIVEYYRSIQAVKLIINSNLKISEIQKECGFSDSKYFYRAFKKYMGCSPLKFRNKMISNNSIITKYYGNDIRKFLNFLNGDRGSLNTYNNWIEKLSLHKIEEGYYLGKTVNEGGLSQRYCLLTYDFKGEINIFSDEWWYFQGKSPSDLLICSSHGEKLVTLGGELLHESRLFIKSGSKVRLLNSSADDFTLITIAAVCSLS